MKMERPEPTFAALVAQIRENYLRFSYLHVVEPRIAGAEDREALAGESNDFLRAIWKRGDSASNGSVYLNAGGYTPHAAFEQAENDGELVAFGRYFVSNVGIYSHFARIWILDDCLHSPFLFLGSTA